MKHEGLQGGRRGLPLEGRLGSLGLPVPQERALRWNQQAKSKNTIYASLAIPAGAQREQERPARRVRDQPGDGEQGSSLRTSAPGATTLPSRH